MRRLLATAYVTLPNDDPTCYNQGIDASSHGVSQVPRDVVLGERNLIDGRRSINEDDVDGLA